MSIWFSEDIIKGERFKNTNKNTEELPKYNNNIKWNRKLNEKD